MVLRNEVGGRWNDPAGTFLRTQTRLRGYRAPAAVHRSAASGWARRWWGLLSVAVQVAVAEIMPRGLLPSGLSMVPPLEAVLSLAGGAGPSLPPLRRRRQTLETMTAEGKRSAEKRNWVKLTGSSADAVQEGQAAIFAFSAADTVINVLSPTQISPKLCSQVNIRPNNWEK